LQPLPPPTSHRRQRIRVSPSPPTAVASPRTSRRPQEAHPSLPGAASLLPATATPLPASSSNLCRPPSPRPAPSSPYLPSPSAATSQGAAWERGHGHGWRAAATTARVLRPRPRRGPSLARRGRGRGDPGGYAAPSTHGLLRRDASARPYTGTTSQARQQRGRDPDARAQPRRGRRSGAGATTARARGPDTGVQPWPGAGAAQPSSSAFASLLCVRCPHTQRPPRRPRPSSAFVPLLCVRRPHTQRPPPQRPRPNPLPRRSRPCSASAAPKRSALPGVHAPPRRTRPQRSALPDVCAPTRRSSPRACCAATAVLPSPSLVQPHPLSFSHSRCRQHPFIAFVGSVAVAAFPAGSTLLRPFRLDPPSLWLDRVFPARSVAVVAFPTGSVVSPSILSRARTP
jgi:hypothetical protein